MRAYTIYLIASNVFVWLLVFAVVEVPTLQAVTYACSACAIWNLLNTMVNVTRMM